MHRKTDELRNESIRLMLKNDRTISTTSWRTWSGYSLSRVGHERCPTVFVLYVSAGVANVLYYTYVCMHIAQRQFGRMFWKVREWHEHIRTQRLTQTHKHTFTISPTSIIITTYTNTHTAWHAPPMPQFSSSRVRVRVRRLSQNSRVARLLAKIMSIRACRAWRRSCSTFAFAPAIIGLIVAITASKTMASSLSTSPAVPDDVYADDDNAIITPVGSNEIKYIPLQCFSSLWRLTAIANSRSGMFNNV